MTFDILLTVIAGLVSLIGAGIFSEISKNFLVRVLKRSEPEETYSQKLTRLTENLVNPLLK